MKKALFNYSALFLSIFALDRATKWFALHNFAQPYNVMPGLQFKLVFNRGISWGMFHSEHHGFFILLSLLIVSIVIALILFTYKKWQQGGSVAAETAVLAGAISNVIDRYFYGGVVDFIHVYIGDWSWPIFNVADMAIVLGIFYILYEQWKES